MWLYVVSFQGLADQKVYKPFSRAPAPTPLIFVSWEVFEYQEDFVPDRFHRYIYKFVSPLQLVLLIFIPTI